MKPAGIWVCWWLFMMAVWMLLVGTWAGAEVLAGVAVAALAATAAEVVRRSGLIRFRPWGLLPHRPWRLPVIVVADCWLLAVALQRQPPHRVGCQRAWRR